MRKLNEQQQQAVDSNSSKILCLAGAGAGKTATMIERISRLVKDGVPPLSILVLTFTNAAAFEMKERYKQSHINEVIPEFRTFHSFCYSLIIKDKAVRTALDYIAIPTIADEGAIKRIETEAKMQCNIKLPQAKIEGSVALTQQEQFELDLYKKAVKRLIRQKNIITFDILCYDVGELFVRNDPSILKYKDQYSYLFVDEFQDTDPKQIQFLNSFDPKSTHFYFCGDCLQNIYQFRNCSNETIKKLAKDGSWEQIKLFQNYRSTREICSFANKMSTYADEEYRIEMNGQRDGDKVDVVYGAHSTWTKLIDDDHMDHLLERIDSLNGEDAAILCRTNKEVDYVCHVLTENEIPYVTGKRNVDSIHILKSVLDNEYMLDWLATFLSAEKYSEYIRLAAQVENPDIKWFANTYGQTPKINERGKKIVAIRGILNKAGLGMSKCADILKELDIKDIVLEDVPEEKSEIVHYLIEEIEEAQSSELYVGTIHSSKGLEYGTVFVMGVDDKSFPLSKGEEMLNLYYVAITRAKNHLVVYRT